MKELLQQFWSNLSANVAEKPHSTNVASSDITTAGARRGNSNRDVVASYLLCNGLTINQALDRHMPSCSVVFAL